MKELKLKIFDVLSKRILITEFETWLYNSEEILSGIQNNNFVYQVITVNYRDEKALYVLEKITFDFYDKIETNCITIEKICREILVSQTIEEIDEVLYPFRNFFEYETESRVLWVFYELYEELMLVLDGFSNKKYFLVDSKKLASKTLEKLERCITISDRKNFILSGNCS